MIFVSFFIVFSCTLAFGVTYNVPASRWPSEAASSRRCGCSVSRAARFHTACSVNWACSRSPHCHSVAWWALGLLA